MQKLTTMFNTFVGMFQRGGCTISKSRNTHKRAVAPQHATDHGDRGARASSGKRQLLGKWSRELPHLRELLLLCACVRAGGYLRPNLETTSGEEIRSGRNTLFRCFSDIGICQNQHPSPHAVYTDLTVGESCIDQDIWPA